MARADLLALTWDDLVTLTNRGIVKRATKELDSGKFECELTEDDQGNITAKWHDGTECVLPAGGALQEARCSSGAVGISRHVIRSVLYYQRISQNREQARVSEETPTTEPALPEVSATSWNPGAISDAELAQHYRKAKQTQARKTFEQGLVLELRRGPKPSAYFHDLSVTTRFLVPDDIRYTYCDCREEAPCSHVLLAIWAFRLLEPEREAGLMATHVKRPGIPLLLLEEVENALHTLLEIGLSSAPGAVIDRFRRLDSRCRDAGLVWPAEILADLLLEHQRYAEHDARFDPAHLAHLIGELCIRVDVIRNDTGVVPAFFVRGTQHDRVTEVGSARLIGLGCGVKTKRGAVELMAYMQDAATGRVVAMYKEFPDPSEEEAETPRSFAKLSKKTATRGISLASLGAGQLLIKGGKRLPNGQFVPGRAKIAGNPQNFSWEHLRAPLYAENFEEIRAHLRIRPPASLRPRRLGEDLFVCAVKGIESVTFSRREQAVMTLLYDADDQVAALVHPYHSRGAAGVEVLLTELQTNATDLRFVTGLVRLGRSGLLVSPVALVFERNNARYMIQPWIESLTQREDDRDSSQKKTEQRPSESDPTTVYPSEVLQGLGELLVVGLTRAGSSEIHQLEELTQRGQALGFFRFLYPLDALLEHLRMKPSALEWDWKPAAISALEGITLARLALEEHGV